MEVFDSCAPSTLVRRAALMAFGMLSSTLEDLHTEGEELLSAINTLET